MPENFRAGEIFGARPQVWLGILAAVASLFIVYRIFEGNVGQGTKTSSPAQTATPQVSAGRVVAPTLPDVGRRVRPADLPAENIALVTDGRENEPLAVLINELYSPDPETRMAAATRLSRRSLEASEAVPVLKRLSEDEQDPKVRQVMQEAILNIRGFVPPPFKSLEKP